MLLHAPLDSETSEDNANNVEPTVPAAQDQLLHAPHASMDTLLTKLVELVNSLHHANSVNTILNHQAHAPESALKVLSSMKMCASLPVSQDSMITESEVVLLLLLKVDAHSPTILATEFVSATVLQELTLIQPNVSAKAVHPTASVASLTPSAMLAMLDSTSRTESASLQASTAPLDNIDTTVSATVPALLELASKETSVKELAQLEPGHSITVATEPAQPNLPLVMLASTLAPLELHS